ncbi:MAG: citrate synthase [Candidatus Omnitrophica bacterium]|nr:citrate synthase [Candidatus Omnitrophota bacterium]
MAKLKLDGKIYEFPIIVGSENEKAIDISSLRLKTGYITMDNGYANTGSCKSAITFIDGEKGILRYRGIPVEQLAENSSFVETAYLLIYGELPKKKQLEDFSKKFTVHSMIHEDMRNFFNGYPTSGHPMGILSAMVCSLSAYYPELEENEPKKNIGTIAVELISKVRTIAAFSYKKKIGEPFVYPRSDLRFIPNFLNMMFSSSNRDYVIEDDVVEALQTLFILHADHEQNCGTSTVRMVGSSMANLFASVSSGICALWGPLHGGANQKVTEMLEKIQRSGGDVKKFITKVKDRDSKTRLMGFGHRVYKNYDPRARIIKKRADVLLERLGIHDPLLEIAMKLEEIALKDDFFVERKLYPNVDFYSGIIYSAIGIPVDMAPVMFSMARMPGWIAQWMEMRDSEILRINRPRQIYIGETQRDYIPIEKRK